MQTTAFHKKETSYRTHLNQIITQIEKNEV